MGKFIGGIVSGVIFQKLYSTVRKKSLLRELLEMPDDFEFSGYVDKDQDEIVVKIRKRVCE